MSTSPLSPSPQEGGELDTGETAAWYSVPAARLSLCQDHGHFEDHGGDIQEVQVRGGRGRWKVMRFGKIMLWLVFGGSETVLWLLRSFVPVPSLSLSYSFEEVCVAFNGGKDCTTMLDILHAFLTR